MLHNAAIKRLKAEYQRLRDHPIEGISAAPEREGRWSLWRAVIIGPRGTCYEGGVFDAMLTFPPTYPMDPPQMRFDCEMFHPNVYANNGRICISTLFKSKDGAPGAERWSPVLDVEKVLLSVVSLLAEPNCESPVNGAAAKMWLQDRERYILKVLGIVLRTQGKPRQVE